MRGAVKQVQRTLAHERAPRDVAHHIGLDPSAIRDGDL